MIPVELRSRTIAKMFERFKEVKTPGDEYWPLSPNPSFGVDIKYDVLAYGRERGRVNSRGGSAFYEDGPVLGTVSLIGETWRDGMRIHPQEFRDMRAAGQIDSNRLSTEAARRTLQLTNRWKRFKEWMAWEGLQGIKSFYPPGLDQEYTELLLCSDDCLIPEVVLSWAAAPATEAIARTTLMAMRLDFETATVTGAAAEQNYNRCIMNSVTRGYIDANILMAGGGYEPLHEQVLRDAHVSHIFGYDISINDNTYVHPITGVTTKYLPDDVAIFTTSDNASAGREMIECQALDTEAPAGHIGLYFSTREHNEAPGGVKIVGEWTGAPQLAAPCSAYVYQDVTAEIQL